MINFFRKYKVLSKPAFQLKLYNVATLRMVATSFTIMCKRDYSNHGNCYLEPCQQSDIYVNINGKGHDNVMCIYMIRGVIRYIYIYRQGDTNDPVLLCTKSHIFLDIFLKFLYFIVTKVLFCNWLLLSSSVDRSLVDSASKVEVKCIRHPLSKFNNLNEILH